MSQTSTLFPHYNIPVFRRLLIFVLLLSAAFAVAEGTKRLILKNGSYQVVQKYEIKGDRVRYFSAERYQWEEIPYDFIDWDATKKFEAEQAKEDEPKVKKIPSPEEMAKQQQDAMTPEVAPNVRLPKTGGVFVVDTVGGQQELVALTQNTGQVNQHTGKNLLLGKLTKGIAPNTQTVELPGSTSKVQIHVPRPVIYLNTDEDPDDPGSSVARKRYRSRPSSDAYRFQIVKLNRKGNLRIVGNVKADITQQSEANMNVVPTYGEIMTGDVWIKVEPKNDLPPGEYAITQALQTEDINPYVWDFTIASPEGDKSSGKK